MTAPAYQRAMLRSASVTNEYELQLFAVQLLRLYGTGPWWHCPNGEFRSKRTAARLKSMGVRKGVADLCLVLEGGQAGFLELKTDRGRPTPEQRAFGDTVSGMGAMYAIAHSPEEVANILFAWGALSENPLVRRAA